MTDDNEIKIKNASQAARILGVLGWTGFCALVWFCWMLTIAGGPPPEGANSEAVLGAATCFATGCAGGVWFFGLIVGLLIYGLIRR